MAVMTKDDDLKQPQEEIVIVEDLLKDPPEDHDEDPDEEDERVPQESDDDDDSAEEDREAIRERRRKEKQERKVRREEAIKRDKLERDFLLKRNEELERRITAQEQRAHQGDLSSLDAALKKADYDINQADYVISNAINAGNGDDVVTAMKLRDQTLAQRQQLLFQKQRYEQQAPRMPQPQIDPRVTQRAQDFMKEHAWYDASGRGEDSAIMLAIDRAILSEGYDPTSDAYWSELRKRGAKRLPERFTTVAPEQRVSRGGPAVGSGKEHAPTSTRREVYINPERKQALIDMGVWDDKVLRDKYVKRYAEWDKGNKA